MSTYLIIPTKDPYTWIVNNIQVHNFRDDPDFKGERVDDKWGYYLSNPFNGWCTGFETKYAAADEAVKTISNYMEEKFQ